MKVPTTDSLSYIFFLPFCLGFVKNSMKFLSKKVLLVIGPTFFTLVRTLFRRRSYFSTKKSFFFVFCEILWIFVTFFTKYCNLRENIYVLLYLANKSGFYHSSLVVQYVSLREHIFFSFSSVNFFSFLWIISNFFLMLAVNLWHFFCS